MTEEISQNITTDDSRIITEQNVNTSTTTTMMDTSTKEQQMNVVDDATLQAVLSSMTEPQVHDFLEELNKTGKAYLPGIGQTIELLTVPAPPETSTEPSTITVLPLSQISQSQPSAEILLQELTSLIQQPPADIVPIGIEQKFIEQPIETKSNIHINTFGSRQSRTANTYGGTPVVGRPGTAVKSTITSSGGTTIRKPLQQQQTINDERMFFGRPATVGLGQYHNRTGLMSNKQQSLTSSLGQQRRITTSSNIEHHQQSSQRRPLSWFQNRSRHRSSEDDDDDADSDRDLSPPSYSMSGNDNLGPTRRSTRVPKPKQDADFVTFPLLDRDEHGNPIPPTPSSMPLHKAEDDEDDIPYRLMDYPRPPQQSQISSGTSSQTTTIGPGRKPRAITDMRTTTTTTTTTIANKKQPRWPDDELYHVKSFIPLIMPQQITNPSTMKNKMTMCKPLVFEREVEAKPTRFTIATQTEMEHMIPDVPLVTLPVPLYLPSPSPSYRLFQPKAVPIPVPVFVPIMIPVSKKTYKNIREYLQTQRDLLPDDPFEAALVMHAESLVRAENQPQQTIASHVNDSMMMMDLTRDDSYLATSQTIENLPELDLEAHYIDPITSNDPEVQKLLRMLPDAGDHLKWTYGVEAFQQWSTQRNRSILYPSTSTTPEDEAIAKEYLIKSDLLSYTNGDELQPVMDVFIREVRRPTGHQYLPESIYYLCLGIQFYLNLNNRQIDLFDPRYVEFNSTLNKILLNYIPRVVTDSNTYVSLIDEDLLYDVHQFGTLTPWSLLTTLIYTNTKYFNLKTVESHMAISFANFGKYSQWIRLSTSIPQGQQMNYLRFYAHNPDLKSLANSPTVYEITEQMNDPIRCPIKQYDFYISKCPEQIRGTADIFYLHPITGQILENSPWFSNEPLSATIIDQILNRLKLLPDYYNQTKPVETNSNVTTSQSTSIS
ncbi:unnamed protein product [Rotaria sordida]|uniref:DUF3504 domain-containing protein n=1 Tax=Rotaria sordida TaxID=392033 RepID=A0A813ZGC7_9BILA|nr:unnamed protein product [Rotaria sordida]CAF3733104.1 unnamed protein product [Rotaria sordida]